MIELKSRPRPAPWSEFNQSIRHRWLLPVFAFDWAVAWGAYVLSRTAFLEFLEYCGSFSVLIAVIFYFAGSSERTKMKHYQAWQVINTAQRGGSGGRGDALQDLNGDHVPLVGVDLSDAFLQGVQLEKADLRRGNFHATDLKGANLTRVNLESAGMIFANLRDTQLTGANLANVDLTDADLTGAVLNGCDLSGVNFTRADLRGADLTKAVNWKLIDNMKMANIHSVQNAPPGFNAWALSKGAVDLKSDSEWNKMLPPAGGK